MYVVETVPNETFFAIDFVGAAVRILVCKEYAAVLR
jgi:hypothetical protein